MKCEVEAYINAMTCVVFTISVTISMVMAVGFLTTSMMGSSFFMGSSSVEFYTTRVARGRRKQKANSND